MHTPPFSVCYVLTGSEWGRHAQMTWLSMKSLRMLHPDTPIVLIIDDVTAAAFGRSRERFEALGVRFQIEKSDFESPGIKNRDLRTRLAQLVQGDILYVDGDTVFLRSIPSQCDKFSIRAVLDFNRHPLERPSDHAVVIMRHLEAIGWGTPRRRFNTGVLFIRECDAAREHSMLWHDNWRRVIDAHPIIDHVSDQLSFDETTQKLTETVGVASNEYNVMVPTSPHLAKQAKILHFFGCPKQAAGTLMEHLLTHFDHTGEYDVGAVEKCKREGHPWGPIVQAWQYRRSHNYVRAAVRKISAIASRRARR